MPINANHNHGIDPKCLSMPIIADRCIDRNWSTLGSMPEFDRHWSHWALIRESCVELDFYFLKSWFNSYQSRYLAIGYVILRLHVNYCHEVIHRTQVSRAWPIPSSNALQYYHKSWIYCHMPARWALQQTHPGLRAATRHGVRDFSNKYLEKFSKETDRTFDPLFTKAGWAWHGTIYMYGKGTKWKMSLKISTESW